MPGLYHFLFHPYHNFLFYLIRFNKKYRRCILNFIKNLFKGMAIGSGAILPGISSGVLCVIFGIYDKLVKSILRYIY